ncbi:MAG: sulfite exporter TauE/SafE family protein [Thermoguttaceae bacterium]|jgi:uncharacterized membrane protein YfcA
MYTSPLNAPLVIAAGIVTGVFGAVLGTGGGVFLIPLLVLGFGVPMHYAVATSIISVIATSSAVASTNIERGMANMRLGMALEVATSLGAVAGGVSAGWLAASVLEGFFGFVLLPTAWVMWHGKQAELGATGEVKRRTQSTVPPSARDIREAGGKLGGSYLDESDERVVCYGVRRLPAGLAISFVAGSVSGLLGIGGGVFKVPALHLLCGIPIKAAAATSNFMIGVTAAASAFLYYGRGEVRPVLTAATVVGVVAGSAIGSAANRRIHGRRVRRVFALLLLAVAVQMLYRAWFER